MRKCVLYAAAVACFLSAQGTAFVPTGPVVAGGQAGVQVCKGQPIPSSDLEVHPQTLRSASIPLPTGRWCGTTPPSRFLSRTPCSLCSARDVDCHIYDGVQVCKGKQTPSALQLRILRFNDDPAPPPAALPLDPASVLDRTQSMMSSVPVASKRSDALKWKPPPGYMPCRPVPGASSQVLPWRRSSDAMEVDVPAKWESPLGYVPRAKRWEAPKGYVPGPSKPVQMSQLELQVETATHTGAVEVRGEEVVDMMQSAQLSLEATPSVLLKSLSPQDLKKTVAAQSSVTERDAPFDIPRIILGGAVAGIATLVAICDQLSHGGFNF
jgi:hypothetical protein